MDDKENVSVRAPGVNARMNSTKHAVATAMGVRPTLGRDTAPARLRLGRPEDVPVLRFADARAGGVKTLHLRLQNDTPHPQEVHFENIPREDGFLVDPDRSSVLAGASQLVRVTWCPARPTRTAYCRTMRVTIDDGEGDAGRARRGTNGALRVRVRGDAVASPEPRPRKIARARQARARAVDPRWQPAPRLLGVRAQTRRERPGGSRGARRSPGRETISPRRGGAIESRARGQDAPLKSRDDRAGGADVGADVAGSRWMERRERAFAEWLDATVAPAEASSAPSRRRDADRAARSRLWALYSADAETRDVILRVEAHIDEGRLRLRGVGDGADANPAGINPKSGGSFMEDVRLRDEFRVAVSSYATFWLRAAVDTVVGARATNSIARGSNGERVALVEALMRDEELEREFDAGRGRHAEGYLEALSGTILKRALLLAFLLDRAQAGLPVNTPLLFRRDAPCKSSADVVRAALQASCHGEGDVLRHLALMGYRLYHSQEPIREYDFRVSNLAVDLRDGVRLCRLVDVLGERRGDDSAVAAARFPATSRAAKMHNVRVALDAATKLGVELPADWSRRDPADVVDGHLANTLGLLYALQMHFHAPKLVSAATLDEETEAWRERRRERIVSGLGAKSFHAESLAPAADVVVADEDARAETLLAEEMADHEIGREEEKSGRSAHETRLLRWARAVASCAGVEVNDLSASFADGAALCALVHAYAPRLVSLRSVRRVPREDPSAPPRARASDVRDAIASNFALAAAARDAMGGVPDPNFGGADDVAPDANVVAGHLLFLCARLTRYREEEAAAVVIQRRWRWIKPGTRDGTCGDGRWRRRSSGDDFEDFSVDARLTRDARASRARRRSGADASRARKRDARLTRRRRFRRAFADGSRANDTPTRISPRSSRKPPRGARARASSIPPPSRGDRRRASLRARRPPTTRVPRSSSPRGGGDETQSGVQGVDDAFRLPRDARDDDSTSGDASRRGDATRRRRNPRRARRRDEDSDALAGATREARVRSSSPSRDRRANQRASGGGDARVRSSSPSRDRRSGAVEGLVRQGEVRRRDVRGDDVPDDSTRGGGAVGARRRRRDAAVTCQTIRRGAVARRAAKRRFARRRKYNARGEAAGRRVVAEAREAEARRREAEARRRIGGDDGAAPRQGLDRQGSVPRRDVRDGGVPGAPTRSGRASRVPKPSRRRRDVPASSSRDGDGGGVSREARRGEGRRDEARERAGESRGDHRAGGVARRCGSTPRR